MKERLKDLQVTPQKPVFDKPSTILLIIGESESRDYMSAFSECEYDTTPWLKAKKEDPHFLLFPNSYSCIAHTVSCLERALTNLINIMTNSFIHLVLLLILRIRQVIQHPGIVTRVI